MPWRYMGISIVQKPRVKVSLERNGENLRVLVSMKKIKSVRGWLYESVYD